MLEEAPRSPGERDHLFPSPQGINIIHPKGGFDGPTIICMVPRGPRLAPAGFRVVPIEKNNGPTWSQSGPSGVPCGPTRKKQWSHVVPQWSQRGAMWSQSRMRMVPRNPGVLPAGFRVVPIDNSYGPALPRSAIHRKGGTAFLSITT